MVFFYCEKTHETQDFAKGALRGVWHWFRLLGGDCRQTRRRQIFWAGRWPLSGRVRISGGRSTRQCPQIVRSGKLWRLGCNGVSGRQPNDIQRKWCFLTSCPPSGRASESGRGNINGDNASTLAPSFPL
jgi:hypothetical protein